MIYLDNAATTRVYEESAQTALKYMTEKFYNPSAAAAVSREVKKDVESAREKIARILGVRADEIYFTSGATESNNWAIRTGIKSKKGNVVVSSSEHGALYNPIRAAQSDKLIIRYAPVEKSGRTGVRAFTAMIDSDTVFASCIHVSNETGVENDIAAMASEAKRINPNIIFHSDGAQALLKTDTAIADTGVDLYSASMHKLHAPKGLGVLYIRKGLNLAPLILGGGQENGLRSGTENVSAIIASATSLERIEKTRDLQKVRAIREVARKYLTEKVGAVTVGDECNSGFILTACMPEIKGEILQNILSDKGVTVGIGSACSGARRANRVLSAMGFGTEFIERCIRISFTFDTTEQEVLTACQIIEQCVKGTKGALCTKK